jgi:UDP-N-acetyl-D-glucosamine dehydrogenase
MNLQKAKDKNFTVGIIGLGYVGLPLAFAFAKGGVKVTGFELSEEKVNTLNKAVSYIPDVPTEELAPLVKKGLLKGTLDFSEIKHQDVVFICVPTPFDKQKAPDLTFIENAAEAIAKNLQKEQVIILQSTTHPGTTEEIVQPILEKTGLKAGKDFYLAFSPERIDPGNKKFNAYNTPKVVGGLDKKTGELVKEIFKVFMKDEAIFVVSSTRSAEMCKILENTFRLVNIALVNELTQLCDRMGINIWEVVEAASTKPFGFMPFYPGVGVGGHCIPVDPFYLSWKAREYDFFTQFIEIASDVNMNMPLFVLQKVKRIINTNFHGAKILVLGAAFKKDIDDARNSASIYLIKLLKSEGADVAYNDPYVPEVKFNHLLYNKEHKWSLKSVPLTPEELKKYDLVIAAVNHSSYDYQFLTQHCKLLLDAVNGTKGLSANNVVLL